jgi:hypothetical protein
LAQQLPLFVQRCPPRLRCLTRLPLLRCLPRLHLLLHPKRFLLHPKRFLLHPKRFLLRPKPLLLRHKRCLLLFMQQRQHLQLPLKLHNPAGRFMDTADLLLDARLCLLDAHLCLLDDHLCPIDAGAGGLQAPSCCSVSCRPDGLLALDRINVLTDCLIPKDDLRGRLA